MVGSEYWIPTALEFGVFIWVFWCTNRERSTLLCLLRQASTGELNFVLVLLLLPLGFMYQQKSLAFDLSWLWWSHHSCQCQKFFQTLLQCFTRSDPLLGFPDRVCHSPLVFWYRCRGFHQALGCPGFRPFGLSFQFTPPGLDLVPSSWLSPMIRWPLLFLNALKTLPF